MDRRTPLLKFTLQAVGSVLVLCVGAARGQNPSPVVRRMTVMILGEERGAGFIIGDDKSSIDIITAAHVINPHRRPKAAGLPVNLELHSDLGEAHPDCKVLASAMEEEQVDAAVIRCTKEPNKRYALSYDLGGDVTELRSSAPLMLIGNFPVGDVTKADDSTVPTAGGATPNGRTKPAHKDQSCPVPLMLIGRFPVSDEAKADDSKAPNTGGATPRDGTQPARKDQLCTVPAGYFLFDRLYPSNKDAKVIEFLNLRGYDLQGASGGPLLTDRSEFIGIVVKEYDFRDVLVHALTWSSIAGSEWMKKAGAHVKISRQARSAAPLRRNNVEFTVGAASMYVPNFGLLGISPKFGISSVLPNAPSVVLGFDFTYAKATKLNGSTETVSLTVPSLTAEWQLGGAWGFLRRRQLLGGVYLGGGIAPASLDRSLTGGVGHVNVRSWTGVFDAGWRYRFPGRSWGIHASYREGILFDSSVQQLYPRLREASYGMFVILK